MMAITEHCSKHAFDLNHVIPLVKALKWSQGKKNSKGTLKGIEKKHIEGINKRPNYMARIQIT